MFKLMELATGRGIISEPDLLCLTQVVQFVDETIVAMTYIAIARGSP